MNTYIKNIIATAIGGIILLIVTVVFSAFLSSPPTKAEFDALKVEHTLQYREINGRLKILKQGQDKILDHIIQGK